MLIFTYDNNVILIVISIEKMEFPQFPQGLVE